MKDPTHAKSNIILWFTTSLIVKDSKPIPNNGIAFYMHKIFHNTWNFSLKKFQQHVTHTSVGKLKGECSRNTAS